MRLYVIWLILIGATFASFAIGEDVKAGAVATAVILAIAFVKVRLVIQEFMEVRTAPRALGIAADCWGVLLWGILVTIPHVVPA
jgi:hypothetical protein